MPIDKEYLENREIIKNLFLYFNQKYIISLKNREDRRQRVVRNLASIGIDFNQSGIEWFDGLVFEDAGGFPNIGVRGCFNSHLSLMRRCAASGHPMLVMEDDVDFDVLSFDRPYLVVDRVRREDWDIIYFGYLEPKSLSSGEALTRYTGHTIGGHLYAVRPRFAAAMAAFMSSCLTREPGDPVGGPMYRDAAFNFYRKRHPEYKTWLATPSLAGQFSSRSDLARNPAFYDKAPGLRDIVEIGRQLFNAKLRKRR